MATLPEGVGLDSVLTYVDQPTKTFLIDWNSHQISGFADGLEAMRQAVEIILQNERFRWQIYTADFGSELEELVGEDYDFIISELPRRIRDAFSRDSRILSADNFVFSDGSGGKLVCSFDVHTVFGTISEEVGT